MIRVAGVLVLLVILYGSLFAADPNAGSASNLIEIANRQGFFGVMTIAVGVLMVAGGIDLSIGSVVALSAVGFGYLMQKGVPPAAAVVVTLLGGAVIGLVHGILVTQLRLQAFLVTLCGLFVYRGFARLLTDDKQVGLVNIKQTKPEFASSLDTLTYHLVGQDADGRLIFPAMMIVFLAIALVVGLVLHKTVYGRYWYAIGYSEAAARYAGVDVSRHRITVFVLCSTLSAFAGVLLLLQYGTAKPDNAGQTYELEAITGAVLGGVSLRGGDGTAVGMILGAMVLPLLKNLIVFLEIPNAVVPAVIGLTLLAGTTIDELIRRPGAGKRKRLFAMFRRISG